VTAAAPPAPPAVLASIERRLLWLATLTVHHANAGRPNPDGTKVGGHQASSASLVTILTALYFRALGPDDLVAVKAHAAPAFYAAQYLRGRCSTEDLQSLRSLDGLQAYPSRRKNPALVDLSTGSMGLGAVQASFGAAVQRYLAEQRLAVRRPGRMIVLVGDAELDEGNVWEALVEETLRAARRLIWIVDWNRQSLDRPLPAGRRAQVAALFEAAGFRVLPLRWGRRLRALFGAPGGARLQARLEALEPTAYHALLRLPAGELRKRLTAGPDGAADPELDALLAGHADEELAALAADVGGHDLALVLEALAAADAEPDRPAVILADTVKGWGLPLAADPQNHGALLTAAQLEALRQRLGVPAEDPWARFPAGSPEAAWIDGLPPLYRPPAAAVAPAPVPAGVEEGWSGVLSTQEAFGRLLARLARSPLAERLVTVSADVAVTTHLAAWIGRRGVYAPLAGGAGAASGAVAWEASPRGQHWELGIAEHNLFLALGALGLAHELEGVSLLPVGTVYDPFVTRGLDALYHALYSGARFVLVATPSGVSLAPEGGAHQSVITPPIGVALPDCSYFEPAFAQEVEWILLEALADLAGPRRESYYLRLSTRPVDQRLAPAADEARRAAVLQGGYRLLDARERPGYQPEAAVHLFAAGVLVPEALEAARSLGAEGIHASVFVVTSPDRLYRGLRGPRPHLERLVTAEEEEVPVVSVLDGHSQTLAFVGGALGVPQLALGVDHFGQSGARADLYRRYGIDAPAIAAAARTLLGAGPAGPEAARTR
jgi:pyruvate dehydrogenase E1 component